MTDKIDVRKALEELEEASAAHDEARKAESVASNRETDALNHLNEAQRKFDEAVAGVKDNPPWNSNWHMVAERIRKVK